VSRSRRIRFCRWSVRIWRKHGETKSLPVACGMTRECAWHPCGMASKKLEMDRTFALSSTLSLRWHGPLVQTLLHPGSIEERDRMGLPSLW
jgi:hypothetical protein